FVVFLLIALYVYAYLIKPVLSRIIPNKKKSKKEQDDDNENETPRQSLNQPPIIVIPPQQPLPTPNYYQPPQISPVLKGPRTHAKQKEKQKTPEKQKENALTPNFYIF
ncbi:7390_t:CDS:2, partial [Racocetra fulgida]